jgi:hypothetical protein
MNSEVQRVSGTSGQSVRISLLQDGVERTLQGSHLLVAAGAFRTRRILGWNSQAWK